MNGSQSRHDDIWIPGRPRLKAVVAQNDDLTFSALSARTWYRESSHRC